MSFRAIFKPRLVALLSAVLFLGAVGRVSAAGTLIGALELFKLVLPLLGILAVMGAVSYRLVSWLAFGDFTVGLSRLAFIIGTVAINVCFFGTAIFGVPFVEYMLRER